METIYQKVIPSGDFGIEYPLHESDPFVTITKDELIKLCNHELKWDKRVKVELQDDGTSVSREEYVLIPNDGSEFKRKRDNRLRIDKLKKLLADSDYKAIKYAEGLISASDYAPIKAEREMWRKEINEKEKDI